jgi:hypothetical protein
MCDVIVIYFPNKIPAFSLKLRLVKIYAKMLDSWSICLINFVFDFFNK